MKYSPFLIGLSISIFLFLAHGNPNDKGRFVRFISQKVTNIMCDSASADLCANLCTAAQPLTVQATRGVFTLYTQKPRNYLLFTTFRAELPGLEIRAIGIANTYLVAPVDVDVLQLCDLTGLLFNQDWQSLQRHWEELDFGEEVICL